MCSWWEKATKSICISRACSPAGYSTSNIAYWYIERSTIISTSDPVRVYRVFDYRSLGNDGWRSWRKSIRVGLFELLGYDLKDYGLFEEKFDLLLQINREELVNWEREFRAPYETRGCYLALNRQLPIWRAVGGTPTSAIAAGQAGVPMYLAHLGGMAEVFKHTLVCMRSGR